ncbi:MAG: hypothetical protein P8Y48_11265 [Novosphingobium sp.]
MLTLLLHPPGDLYGRTSVVVTKLRLQRVGQRARAILDGNPGSALGRNQRPEPVPSIKQPLDNASSQERWATRCLIVGQMVFRETGSRKRMLCGTILCRRPKSKCVRNCKIIGRIHVDRQSGPPDHRCAGCLRAMPGEAVFAKGERKDLALCPGYDLLRYNEDVAGLQHETIAIQCGQQPGRCPV